MSFPLTISHHFKYFFGRNLLYVKLHVENLLQYFFVPADTLAGFKAIPSVTREEF